MARGGKIQIDFMAKATDKVSATMKKVNSSVKGTGKSAGAAAGKMGKLNVAMAAIAAAAVVAGKKLLDLANETAAYGDNVAKTSTRIGVSVEEFQRLDHALKISGSSMDEQKGSFIRLARVADDANSGLKTAKDAFDRLGVSVTDADGVLKNQPQLLADVSDAFAAMANGTEKTALAAELFGRKGTDMLQFLNLGSEGMRKLGDEAESLGAVMSGPAAKAAEEYTDSVTRLEAAWDGLKRALGSEVMPMIQRVIDFLTRSIKPADHATDRIRNYGDVVRRESKATADQIVRDSKRMAQAFEVQGKSAQGSMVAQALAAQAQAQASAMQAAVKAEIAEIEREKRRMKEAAHIEAANRTIQEKNAKLQRQLNALRDETQKKIEKERASIKANIAAIQEQARIGRGEDERQILIGKKKKAMQEAEAKGLDDKAQALAADIEDLKDAIHIDKERAKSTGGRTRAVRENTEALRKNVEAQRASAIATLDSVRAELRLIQIPDEALRQRTAIEMEIAQIRRSMAETEFSDIQAEDDRKLALAHQIQIKEIELARMTADQKAEIQREANEKEQAANKEKLDTMREQQSASLALFEQTSAKASGELRGMNKELGATAGAVGQTAAQWQKYSMGQAKIGMAVAGSAAAIGAASTAFVDSEKEKAGILSAMHTAQAIALAFSANPAAAVAHAAAAAMFFGIATGAIKTASPGGGGGGGGAGGSVATPEPAGFTGGGGGGGEGRAINVTFGGGIVLGRPSDVAQAIAQAEFAARGQGRMGGGI